MTDLKVKLYKMIAVYNLSGNGDGNCNLVDEEADWVPLAITNSNFGHWDCTLFNNNNQANLLLILVKFLCTHGMFGSSTKCLKLFLLV